ncbi:unnamed protein product [Rhizoctonia solani]|uniref:Uncharacterized protein n=2 Tax=Rhizoctonia solani TaxID=456999 RepID=A0A8H2Y2E1_9AGAM|nr:putative transmembrane protein [Rhizoctonia solani 123E]CAE6440612.1 unnamed protein product [Rhizoctonia solani]
MSSFLRIAGAAALVISFGLAARALPLDILNINISPLNHSDAVCHALNKMIDADIVVKLRACVNAGTIADVKVAIDACVEVIKVCADALLKIDAGVTVDAVAKADIVACIAALITLIVKVCLQLTLKFGVSVVATLFVELDACVRLLLVNLDICIAGILDLIVKACVSVTLGLLAQVKLSLCANLFAGL